MIDEGDRVGVRDEYWVARTAGFVADSNGFVGSFWRLFPNFCGNFLDDSFSGIGGIRAALLVNCLAHATPLGRVVTSTVHCIQDEAIKW